MEKDIGKILKGEYQGNITEIVVAIKEFNDRVGVDIREYSKSEQYTGPTKKGLRIPADKFDEFKKMIDSIDPKDLSTAAPVQESLPEPTSEKDDSSGIDESGLM